MPSSCCRLQLRLSGHANRPLPHQRCCSVPFQCAHACTAVSPSVACCCPLPPRTHRKRRQALPLRPLLPACHPSAATTWRRWWASGSSPPSSPCSWVRLARPRPRLAAVAPLPCCLYRLLDAAWLGEGCCPAPRALPGCLPTPSTCPPARAPLLPPSRVLAVCGCVGAVLSHHRALPVPLLLAQAGQAGAAPGGWARVGQTSATEPVAAVAFVSWARWRGAQLLPKWCRAGRQPPLRAARCRAPLAALWLASLSPRGPKSSSQLLAHQGLCRLRGPFHSGFV